MADFTLGCDPEVFVTYKGKAVSAHGMIPGNKTEPHKTENGAVQVDGMALELNTNPVPIKDFEAFNTNVVKQIQVLREMVNEGRDEKDRIQLSLKPVMDFEKEVMENSPDEAKELGCDPDFSAYTLEPNPRPQGNDVLFRTGAGHLHIGWGADIPIDNEEHMKICAGFVKALDVTVGAFMTVIDREPRRRELYGKAGAFRPKSYGVEYRTPSNVWLKNRPMRQMIHTLVNRAIYNHTRGQTPEQLFWSSTSDANGNRKPITQEEIREMIDTGDHVLALRLVDEMLPYDTVWKSNRASILDAVKKQELLNKAA